ncbi:MAG: 16S rRNA (guanine(527)-N(7))-methyltransferase RsmG [Clostridiales bacterium]|nr:16S rRNA (guanine(527)-N(7))-methyltransferase RsmG [Clostridiales bacterium]
MREEFIRLLTEGLAAMRITPPEGAVEKMAQFQEMLAEANEHMNLTRVSFEPREAVDRNYLDSVAPLAHGLADNAKYVLDIGSGAGFPGIPMAIMIGHHARVVMVDSLKKRVLFLQEAIDKLGLNAEAVHSRMEDFSRAKRGVFDLATARAVAKVGVLSELAVPALKIGGSLIAYKGPSAGEELAEAERALRILGAEHAATLPAPIPGRDWEHSLVVVKKVKKTPDQYPRKAGEPEKKPL